MQSLVLTKEEIEQLTGFKHRRCQARELAQLRIPFSTTTNGDIKILRASVLPSPIGERQKARVNLDALKAATA